MEISIFKAHGLPAMDRAIFSNVVLNSYLMASWEGRKMKTKVVDVQKNQFEVDYSTKF